jgi:Ulp1 family protease
LAAEYTYKEEGLIKAYQKVSSITISQRHSKLKVDLLSKDFIFFLINVPGHWVLVVVVRPSLIVSYPSSFNQFNAHNVS